MSKDELTQLIEKMLKETQEQGLSFVDTFKMVDTKANGREYTKEVFAKALEDLKDLDLKTDVDSTTSSLHQPPSIDDAKMLQQIYGKPVYAPKTSVETFQDENGNLIAKVTHMIERTLAELIDEIKATPFIEDVQVVYDLPPEEVAILISYKGMTGKPRNPTTSPIRFIDKVEELITETTLTDYKELEWTIRIKGVRRFDVSK